MSDARDPDEFDTARSLPLTLRCSDCAAEVCDGELPCPVGDAVRCRSCAETRRLLPRFLSLVRGRAHVRELLAEIDALGL